MDLRLSVTKRNVATVVHVEGRLATATVRLLQEAVQDSVGAVSLDLSNLMSADDAGIAALRALQGRGVRLTGVSPYIGLLLAADIGRGQAPDSSEPKATNQVRARAALGSHSTDSRPHGGQR